MTGRYNERTGRSRSPFVKGHSEFGGSIRAPGAGSLQLAFGGITNRLRRIKHIRGELTFLGSAVDARATGWHAWVRWPRGETLTNADINVQDPRLWTPRPFAYIGNFPRSYPVDLMAANVTPEDDLYWVLWKEGGTATSILYEVALIFDEEEQVRA